MQVVMIDAKHAADEAMGISRMVENRVGAGEGLAHTANAATEELGNIVRALEGNRILQLDAELRNIQGMMEGSSQVDGISEAGTSLGLSLRKTTRT